MIGLSLAAKIEAELAEYRANGVSVARELLTYDVLLARLKAFGKMLGKKYNAFKSPEQELAVWRALDGVHTLAVLPTGAGKSLSFQLPAYLTAGQGEVTLVISPLLALMKMHADLPRTETITGDTEPDQRPQIWARLASGESSVLLVGPERLAQVGFQTKLYRQMKAHKLRFARFVVDEVHCLSDWGHDFRPHYWWVAHHLRTLEQRMKARQDVPRLLLTATADAKVIEDIAHHFPEVADSGDHIVASVAREELFLGARKVKSLTQRKRALVRFLSRQASRPLPKGVRRRGIIYNTLAIRQEDPEDEAPDFMAKHGFLRANQVVDLLKKRGFKKTFPYASRGMNKHEKDYTLRKFEKAGHQKGKRKVVIVVATSAFGLGMDYPKVPFVCHLYPRTTIAEYWQQVGRAGRDMNPRAEWAETMAIVAPGDKKVLGRFAKAPAIDGLVNVYTMPLHHWMYVWERGSAEMSLLGKGGGVTQFARLLQVLQDNGIVASRPTPCAVPPGTVRYAVHVPTLRKKTKLLLELRHGKFKTKKLRKVFRYLLVTAASRKGKWIILNQLDYAEDKAGTVLQRLNRWVDIGGLTLDSRFKKPGMARLRKSGVNLTARSLKAIQKNANAWAKHKLDQLDRAVAVLGESTPEKRKQKVLAAFQSSPRVPPFPHKVPAWMRRTMA